MERLKQSIEDLRIGPSRGRAALHRFDEAVPVVGERLHHGRGNRSVDPRKVGHQDLHRDLARTVAGGKNQEYEWGHT